MKNNSSGYNKNHVVKSLGLSPREAEVLSHVAEGKTNCEVSSILGISERTVEKHLERVYAKLGVETRTAASAAIYFMDKYAQEKSKRRNGEEES